MDPSRRTSWHGEDMPAARLQEIVDQAKTQLVFIILRRFAEYGLSDVKISLVS